MDISKDYYATLGVLPSAEDFVIQAAYRALSKVYHPDVYKGDDADEKMAEINEAYEVLGNKAKRMEYDQQRSKTESDDSEFFNENFSAETHDYDPLHDDWKMALEYYPELLQIIKRLARISSRLAFNFRVYIVQEKRYSEAERVAEEMEKNFLTQFFGSNFYVHNFALQLIDRKEKATLLELNKAIKVMGSGDGRKIAHQLAKKHGIDFVIEDEVLVNEYCRICNSVDSSAYLIVQKEYFQEWKVGKISNQELVDEVSMHIRKRKKN